MYAPYHYIGLDVHKRQIVFCEKRADGEIMDKGKFGATREAIASWVSQRSRPWIGGMEATLFTGHLYDALAPHAVELHVGHPFHIKAISFAKHKSDKADAATLADLLRADLFPRCHMAPMEVRELRRLLRYRNFLVRQAVRMKNKTTGLLMEVGAPYNARRIHQRHYFEELLGNLEETPASVLHLLRTTRASLEFFQEAQKELLKALVSHEQLHERVALLRTIPGVGEITALTWALEVDCPARFSSVKHLTSYCGLCSGRNESAGKNKSGPLSKQRNPHLQAVLIEAAKLAPRWNAQLKAAHTKALAEENNLNRATCAVARKLAAYLLAVDKSQTPYHDPSQA